MTTLECKFSLLSKKMRLNSLVCVKNTVFVLPVTGELNTGVPKTQHGTRQVTGCGWKMEPPLDVESPPVEPTSLINTELPKESDTH